MALMNTHEYVFLDIMFPFIVKLAEMKIIPKLNSNSLNWLTSLDVSPSSSKAFLNLIIYIYKKKSSVLNQFFSLIKLVNQRFKIGYSGCWEEINLHGYFFFPSG